ncbi:MAG: HEAT repeat domain-containing protein [candidate division WOR-3 bacterium]|jgi:HEAT repeat protein
MKLKKLSGVVLVMLLLTGCGSEVQRLRRNLSVPKPEVRAYAARRLGELRDRNSVPQLINLLKDSVPVVVFEAARALGKIRDKSALAPLKELALNSASLDLAVVATRAIIDFGPSGLGLLIELLDSPRAPVRLIACQGLGQIGSNRAVEPLIHRLRDTDPGVRKAAMMALRQIGDPRGMEAIARMVSSPEQITEQGSEEALSGGGYLQDWERLRPVLRRLRP